MEQFTVASRRSVLAALLAVPWFPALAGAAQITGDLFDVHRRMFVAADGVEVVWWFLGKMYFEVDGYPEVMARYGDNLIIYRATALSKDAHVIDWVELNAPRNALTGLPDTRWTNPFTGKSGELRTDKPYGPSRYVFTRQNGGVAVEINQPGVTALNTAVRSTGVYLSSSNQLPTAFAGFSEDARGQMIVRALMHKASLDEIIDRLACDGMKAAHPSWFDGDRLTPRWPGAAK